MGHLENHNNDLQVRHKRRKQVCEIGTAILWTTLVVLLVVWLNGVATSYTLGGLINVLLLVAGHSL